MKEMIGETAGNIWLILGKEGRMNLTRLPRLLKRKSGIVHQALGWLAREDKICLETDGAKTFVSLNASEQVKFTDAKPAP